MESTIPICTFTEINKFQIGVVVILPTSCSEEKKTASALFSSDDLTRQAYSKCFFAVFAGKRYTQIRRVPAAWMPVPPLAPVYFLEQHKC